MCCQNSWQKIRSKTSALAYLLVWQLYEQNEHQRYGAGTSVISKLHSAALLLPFMLFDLPNMTKHVVGWLGAGGRSLQKGRGIYIYINMYILYSFREGVAQSSDREASITSTRKSASCMLKHICAPRPPRPPSPRRPPARPPAPERQKFRPHPAGTRAASQWTASPCLGDTGDCRQVLVPANRTNPRLIRTCIRASTQVQISKGRVIRHSVDKFHCKSHHSSTATGQLSPQLRPTDSPETPLPGAPLSPSWRLRPRAERRGCGNTCNYEGPESATWQPTVRRAVPRTARAMWVGGCRK